MFLEGIMLIIVVPEFDSWKNSWTKTGQAREDPCLRGITRHTELRAALEIQGWLTAASQSGNSKSTALATAMMEEGTSPSVQHHSQSPAPLLMLLVGTEPIQQDPPLAICFGGRCTKISWKLCKASERTGFKKYPHSSLQFLKCWGFTASANSAPPLQYILALIRSTCCSLRLWFGEQGETNHFPAVRSSRDLTEFP